MRFFRAMKSLFGAQNSAVLRGVPPLCASSMTLRSATPVPSIKLRSKKDLSAPQATLRTCMSGQILAVPLTSYVMLCGQTLCILAAMVDMPVGLTVFLLSECDTSVLTCSVVYNLGN